MIARRAWTAIVVTALLTLAAGTGVAGAHTSGDASFGHTLLEIVRWTAIVGIVLGALLAVFWVRAHWRGGRES